MRVVFMGTPEFAVPTLEELIDAGHSVVGVFTQPDKAVGRKQIITPPPVKVCATKHNIPVFQPNTLKTAEAEELIKGLNPDVVVFILAFFFNKACINSSPAFLFFSAVIFICS